MKDNHTPGEVNKPQEYKIDNIRDFLKVPMDRLDDCLKEFCGFIAMTRSSLDIMEETGIGEYVDMEIVSFTWVDDGETNKTILVNTTITEASDER